MPGPPPKPADQRRRTNAPRANTMLLPAEGRDGETPEWPLSSMRDGEPVVWADLWRTPQAVAWERLGWTRSVARYCRSVVAADMPDAPVSLLGEVRQMEDRLGLSPLAMLRLCWEVDQTEEAATATSSGNVVTPDRWRRESTG